MTRTIVNKKQWLWIPTNFLATVFVSTLGLTPRLRVVSNFGDSGEIHARTRKRARGRRRGDFRARARAFCRNHPNRPFAL